MAAPAPGPLRSVLLLHLLAAWPAVTRGISMPTGALEPKDTLVILRSHDPSNGMRNRMVELALDVMSNVPNAHMIVSVDDSHLNESQKWFVPLPAENVQRYVWDDVTTYFNNINWTAMEDPSMAGLDVFYATGKNFHMEPIWLTVKWAMERVNLSPDAKIWALEDDVLVCGNFSEIVKAYSMDPSDFLSGNRRHAYGWNHNEMASLGFKMQFPMKNRHYSFEFVERFSLRFLKRTMELARNGVTANSEMFAPTLCWQEGYSHNLFSRAHVGKWAWDLRLSAKQAHRQCQLDGVFMNHAAKLFSPTWEEDGNEEF